MERDLRAIGPRSPRHLCGVLVAAIGGVATLGGAVISSNAASNAAGDAANAAAQNNALQSQIYDSNKGIIQPYVDAGNAANTELQGFLGLGGNPGASAAALQTYLGSTGYQFAKNEGMSAITGDKAASGLLDSGSTLQALDSFGTGLANQYGQQYEQNLQGEVNTGLGAVNALTGAGTNYANQVSANNNSAATAAGNAGLVGAGQVNSLIGNAFSAYGAFRGMSSFGGGAGTATPNGNAFGFGG